MRKLTNNLIIIGSVGILIYDAFAYYKGGNEFTISYWFWINSKETPVIPFFSGIICGHLFWGSRGNIN